MLRWKLKNWFWESLTLSSVPPGHRHVLIVLIVVWVCNVDIVVIIVVVVVVIVVVILIVVDVVGRVDDGVDEGEDEWEVAEGGRLAGRLTRFASAVGQEHDRLLAP